MSADTGRPGKPPSKDHPLTKLAKGRYFEIEVAKTAAMRSTASRYGKKLGRVFEVRKLTGEDGTAVTRIYRTR